MATKKTAVKTVLTAKDVIREYVETQGQINELSDEVSEIREARSKHLMQVAKAAGKVETFLKVCEQAEEFILSSAAGKHRQDKVPRAWIQAKSNIKKAMEKGIDLTEHESESSLRKELNQLRKAGKGGGEQEGEVVEPLTYSAELGAIVQRVLKGIHDMVKAGTPESEAKAKAIMLHADAQIAEFLSEILPVEPKASKKKAA